MFGILFKKELKAIIQSPAFVLSFAVLSILILLSTYTGIQEYISAVSRYNTALELVDQRLEQARSFRGLQNQAYRKPEPLQIFASGINNDLGRYSVVSDFEDIKLKHSYYSDDPIYAVFRNVDFSFIVTVVFALFAILFTYNSISGEREGGTLKLVFSNSVSRAQFLAAKTVGSWTALAVPLLVPILTAVLMLFLFNIQLSGEEWAALVLLIILAYLYLSFFIVFGIFVSSLTRYSSSSFLMLLVVWIIFVFIIPRAGAMAADTMVEVPGITELDSKKEAYQNMKWDEYGRQMDKIWEQREKEMSGMSETERRAYQEANEYDWMKEGDKLRKELQKDVAEYTRKLTEEMRNKKVLQEELALTLSRLSPASSFQLAAMNLSGRDVELKKRYEDALSSYKNEFVKFTEKKQEENGSDGMFRISVDSDEGISINTPGREESKLDLSEMPRFNEPEYSVGDALSASIIDFGLLMLYSLLSFGAAFYSFLRYDMR